MNDGGVGYTPGGTITYTVIVLNNSASNATGAVVTDVFGAQITGASWTCLPSDPGATCAPAGGSPLNDTINLAAGTSVTYTITANVSGSSVGPLLNTATVTTAFETDPGDNLAMTSTPGPGGGAGGLINIGPPDGNPSLPPSGTSITMVISPAIAHNFVFYERPASAIDVQLDMIQIEISSDNVTWHTVFYWGDPPPPGTSDTNTNVALPVGGACPTEADNCVIPFGSLYNSTGITIDIDSLGLTGSYPWVRITCPAVAGEASDGCDIDAIEP